MPPKRKAVDGSDSDSVVDLTGEPEDVKPRGLSGAAASEDVKPRVDVAPKPSLAARTS